MYALMREPWRSSSHSFEERKGDGLESTKYSFGHSTQHQPLHDDQGRASNQHQDSYAIPRVDSYLTDQSLLGMSPHNAIEIHSAELLSHLAGNLPPNSANNSTLQSNDHPQTHHVQNQTYRVNGARTTNHTRMTSM